MYCDFSNVDNEWVCSKCGIKVPVISDKIPVSLCYTGINTFQENKLANVRKNSRKQINIKNRTDAGPGTELKKLLSYIGIKASPTCSCNQRAKIMDAWGPDMCEKNINDIIRWLKEEADKRGLPFIETVALMIVNKAIKNARKKLSSSSRP